MKQVKHSRLQRALVLRGCFFGKGTGEKTIRAGMFTKLDRKPERKLRVGEIVSGRVVVARTGIAFVRLPKRRFAAELVLARNGHAKPLIPEVGAKWRCKVIQTGPGLARLSPLGPRR